MANKKEFYAIILDVDDTPASDQWRYVAKAATEADAESITSYDGGKTSVSKKEYDGTFIKNTTVTRVNTTSAKIYKLTANN